MEKLRIYVGGLGASVMEDDLKRTFTSPVLGSVESVEIFRSKGRNFAYLDFAPISEKGLAKLFSMYNGCMWKGGKLKLEKAKEHYLSRLRREWVEDSELAVKLVCQNSNTEDKGIPSERTKKDIDSPDSHIRIFFPKLRKIKPLPFKGSGKHKYSFQRVEIPRLPIHFCDCEEHSMSPSVSNDKRLNKDRDMETCVVNEEELDMVKSVLHRLLERENDSKTVSDDFKVNSDEESQLSDEDGLVINTVSNRDNEFALILDHRQEKPSSNPDSLSGKSQSLTGSHIPGKSASREGKTVNEKRKGVFPSEEDANATLSSKKKEKRELPGESGGYFQTDEKSLMTEALTGRKMSTNAAYLRKNSWKDLVRQRENSSFHISDVLTPQIRNVDEKLGPRRKRDLQKMQSSKVEESEELHHIQSVDEKLSQERERDIQKTQSSKDEGSEELHHIQSVDEKLRPQRERDVQKPQSSKVKESEEFHHIQSVDEKLGPQRERDVQKTQSSKVEELEELNNIQSVDKKLGLQRERDIQEAQSIKVEESEELNDIQSADEKLSPLRERDIQEPQSSKVEESEGLNDIQPIKQSDVEDKKSARGAYWLQNSSWLQLVGKANTNSFSLAQILPGTASVDENCVSSSKKRKKPKISTQDENFPMEQKKMPLAEEYTDISADPGNSRSPFVESLKEEEPNENVSVSDAKETASLPLESDIVISETCPFMRSAASMKQWTKMKAALLKKEKVKE